MTNPLLESKIIKRNNILNLEEYDLSAEVYRMFQYIKYKCITPIMSDPREWSLYCYVKNNIF